MRGRHSKQLDDPRLSQQSMAPSLSSLTHMHGSPRICVESSPKATLQREPNAVL
ncbi:hypothetical protein PIB30_109288, partial [Stylosanthes scabra]|nr:hypothetical protein [Stylosanthes scabra]